MVRYDIMKLFKIDGSKPILTLKGETVKNDVNGEDVTLCDAIMSAAEQFFTPYDPKNGSAAPKDGWDVCSFAEKLFQGVDEPVAYKTVELLKKAVLQARVPDWYKRAVHSLLDDSEVIDG